MATATEVQETWRNYTRGVIGVRHLDHRGELTGKELVQGGRIFHVTSLERRLNQEKVAEPTQDPFLNGMCIPITLDANDPDTKVLLANPNIVADDDLDKLVKGSPKAMVARLEQITNLLTLERILAHATADPDITLRRVEAIKARIMEIRTTVAQKRRAEAQAAEKARDDAPGRRGRRLAAPSANTDRQ